MNGDELVSWMLRTALNSVVSTNPSLFGNLVGSLNVNKPALLRIENFPVYIQITAKDTDSASASPPAPLSTQISLEDPRDGTLIAKSTEPVAKHREPDLTERVQVHLDPAPLPYRLWPALGVRRAGKGPRRQRVGNRSPDQGDRVRRRRARRVHDAWGQTKQTEGPPRPRRSNETQGHRSETR